MKLPFLKKKPAEPSAIPMTKQQIIPKGVSSHVRTREEIYTQARLKTELDEPALPISPEVTAFLQRHGQAPEQLDMAALTASFRSAMEAGLRGEGGLPMMPTYLSDAGTLPGETPVAVLDAGGTHLRAAVVSTHNGSTLVTQSETLPLPGSKAPVSWEDFIAASVDLLEPRLDEVRHIGVCFCYPAEATPEHDLRVQTMTKEVRISGCEGQLVCASLAAELKRRGRTGFTFTALNDTAAALLLGKTTIPPRYASGFAGMVMGTGMNTCCVLPAERIPKLGQSEAGARMLVNLESGSFTDVPQGDFDRALDAASENPGAYLFEKMISGRYLGELCRLALRHLRAGPRHRPRDHHGIVPPRCTRRHGERRRAGAARRKTGRTLQAADYMRGRFAVQQQPPDARLHCRRDARFCAAGDGGLQRVQGRGAGDADRHRRRRAAASELI